LVAPSLLMFSSFEPVITRLYIIRRKRATAATPQPCYNFDTELL
jgi:hypothetical protein